MAWKRSDVISAASAACAIVVFGLGVLQYRSSENWKRSEFVATQIKEFNADQINRSVLLMLDYDGVLIELYPNKQEREERYVEVTLDMLVTSINKDAELSDDELQIKIYFEHFLSSLSRLNYFLTSGAIRAQELCADLSYSIDLMTGDAREMKLKNTGIDTAPFSEAVRNYIIRWEYWDIAQFAQKMRKACK